MNRAEGEEDEVIDIMTITHGDDVATEPNTRREDDSPFSLAPGTKVESFSFSGMAKISHNLTFSSRRSSFRNSTRKWNVNAIADAFWGPPRCSRLRV